MKTWIIWLFVNGLICSGFSLIYVQIMAALINADEETFSWMRTSFPWVLYAFSFLISFLTFRWALQKFLLPKI